MIALFVGFCTLGIGLWWGRKGAPVAEKLVVRNTEDHSLLKNAHVQRLALLGSQAATARRLVGIPVSSKPRTSTPRTYKVVKASIGRVYYLM